MDETILKVSNFSKTYGAITGLSSIEQGTIALKNDMDGYTKGFVVKLKIYG